ncbi:prepilin peptidase [Candidatus Dojkabacteria bacterium]|uniref:Prepilin peptidase n=1 Tax=Candidatus Dojkabacteria bacterium TaxID=2099670 RepID=A0A847CZV7_9BACT|nr:prepilin peptidase [Candidatus Dojkabacteria bacterium]
MKFQIFKEKLKIEEIISITVFILVQLFASFKVLLNSTCSFKTVFILLILLLIFTLLLFLALKDFKTMEVDQKVSLYLIITLLLLNVSFFLVKGSTWGLEVTRNYFYLPYENLIGAIILGLIFQLIVVITKEKGLGQGDVRIAIICGLLIGSSNLILWLYITIFTALIYGLILAYKKKRFKGLKIPFVPFMVLGIIVVLLLSL